MRSRAANSGVPGWFNTVLTVLALTAPLPRVVGAAGADQPPAAQASVLRREFIYTNAPFPSCHASTIAETSEGMVAAWFGGTDEGSRDVGIWVSRQREGAWSAPMEVAQGTDKPGGPRYPCWNPVLFQDKGGKLLLFYKVGPTPSKWWGMMMSSGNAGQSWSEPHRLPEGMLGPIKNKPVLCADGRLLCPSSTEHDGWKVHVETTIDQGATWTRSGPLQGKEFGAIQPTILSHPGGRLQMLCRSRQGKITECWSPDAGRTWGAMKATGLPNPNSGIDAVTLADGRHVLIYNPVTRGRTPLVAAVSADGVDWKTFAVLEEQPGEYSYPAVIQAADGRVHVTYTWRRQRIRHVVLGVD